MVLIRKHLKLYDIGPILYHLSQHDECQSCGACASACPTEAISMPAGKNYFEISDECVDCGECEAECGFNAILTE